MSYCEFCGKREANYRCKQCGFLQCSKCLERDYTLPIIGAFATAGLSLLATGLSSKSCISCKKGSVKKI